MAFSRWQHELVNDVAVREVCCEARWLFVWGATNGAGASMTGLTRVSLIELREALGSGGRKAEERAVTAALEQLGRKPLARYDFDYGLLWVVNRLRYENTGSWKWLKGAERYALKMPQGSPLMGEFWKMYAALFASENGQVVKRGR